MIKAVIFDLNGIFIQSEPLSKRVERDFGIKQEDFFTKLKEIISEGRKSGAGPAFDHWGKALRSWNLDFTEQEFWSYWFGAEKVSEKMVAFAKKLREQGIKVFILSNNFKERAEYYGHYPWIHQAVDKAYFSFESGFVKPDERAWHYLLKENALKPEECLYFDDQKRNVEAAHQLGIKSFVFTNEEEMEEIVNRHLK